MTGWQRKWQANGAAVRQAYPPSPTYRHALSVFIYPTSEPVFNPSKKISQKKIPKKFPPENLNTNHISTATVNTINKNAFILRMGYK